MSQQQIEPPAWIVIPPSAYRPESLPKRMLDMYTLFGSTEGKTCRRCKNLLDNGHGGHSHRYYKCDLQRLTNGPATDWRARWLACGKFEDKP